MSIAWLRPPAASLGSLLLLAAATAAARDTDGDGVADDQDNCLAIANPSQLDTNQDGFGNRCDTDYDGDWVTSVTDLKILLAARANGAGSSPFAADVDADGDGVVGISDQIIFTASYLQRAGPSGLACAGSIPCPCAPPVIDAVEEVLSAEVEIRWTGAADGGLEIESRAAGGDWAQLASVRPEDSRFIHAPPPGFLEYRMRAYCASAPGGPRWSDYSDPVAFDLPSECEGQAPFDPGLPVVQITDRDHDRAYTGDDIALALGDCSARGGCVLEALPVVYEDVAIVLSDGDGSPCTKATRHCLGPDFRFPRGLVIQGHGSRTVFRSPVWTPPYTPARVLQVWKRPDIRLRLRNLVLDGRKPEQRDPAVPQYDWFHYGFESWHHVAPSLPRNRDGCIHNVTARRFLARGITIADTAGWIIEHSTVEDVGCLDTVTPCPFLSTPSYASTLGYQSAGYGIFPGPNNDDLVIRDNTLRRVAKYAIGLKAGADGGMVGALERPTVVRNRIEQTGEIGIFVAGVRQALVADNWIDSTHSATVLTGARYDTFGILAPTGYVERSVFRDNTILGSSGIAIAWHASGQGNVISGSRIEGSCQERRPARSYRFPDLYVGSFASGTLRLENNVVRDSHCAWALGVYGSPMSVVTTIRGGSYQSGLESVGPVPFQGASVTIQCGTVFEGLAGEGKACVEYGAATGSGAQSAVRTTGAVARSVRGERCSPWIAVDNASKVRLNKRDPSNCAP